MLKFRPRSATAWFVLAIAAFTAGLAALNLSLFTLYGHWFSLVAGLICTFCFGINVMNYFQIVDSDASIRESKDRLDALLASFDRR